MGVIVNRLEQAKIKRYLRKLEKQWIKSGPIRRKRLEKKGSKLMEKLCVLNSIEREK